jgi:hypothetical protein
MTEDEGVKAIIYLQSLAGIKESDEVARKNWKGFADEELVESLNDRIKYKTTWKDWAFTIIVFIIVAIILLQDSGIY